MIQPGGEVIDGPRCPECGSQNLAYCEGEEIGGEWDERRKQEWWRCRECGALEEA